MGSVGYVILIMLINVLIWVVLSLIPRIKNRDKVFIVLSFISLWIFLSIREPYSDMILYEQYFNSISVDHFETAIGYRWEFLFKALLYVIRLFTDNIRVTMCIVAFITLIGPFLFIKRYSRSYLLTVIMFIAIGSFSMQFYVLRQAIAISIFLAFFYLISERKFAKYCAVIVIAALFHKTALILLLLYPLINMPQSRVKTIVFAAMIILVLFFGSQISSLLMNEFYSQYADYAIVGEGFSLLFFYILLYVFYLAIGLITRWKERDEITKTTLFTVVLQFFATQNNAFSRLGAYTKDFFCILIPNSIQKLDNKNRMLFSILLIIACVGFVLIAGSRAFFNYSIVS